MTDLDTPRDVIYAAAQAAVARDRVEADRAQVEAEAAARRGEDLVARADRVASDAGRRIAAIEADTRLSDDAKRIDIEAIKRSVNAERKALRDVYEGQLTDRLDVLRRRLCSPPESASTAEAIARDASFRDAMERARRTEARTAVGHPLADLLFSARLTADSLQERAAMVIALERGDLDVVEAWVETHPNDRAPLEELREVHHRVTDKRERFGRSMAFARI